MRQTYVGNAPWAPRCHDGAWASIVSMMSVKERQRLKKIRHVERVFSVSQKIASCMRDATVTQNEVRIARGVDISSVPAEDQK